MSINRRFFLKSGGIALASLGLVGAAPSFLQRAAFAGGQRATGGRRKTLIVIFQRGAVDGLNMIVPHGESAYYAARPTLAIQRPGSGSEAALDLDGFFGLHPALASLQPLWNERRLAVIHAAGSPDNTRSHFDAQDYMESGTPSVKSTPDGWLNRHLQTRADAQRSPFRAVAVTQQMPRALQGRAAAVAMANLADFSIRAGAGSQSAQSGFEAIYGRQSAADAIGDAGRETFVAVNFLRRANPAQYRPENGAQYPRGRFGQSLLQIAQLIKADVGLEVAFTDTGGWDTHANQGFGARGQLANLLREFGAGIAALITDLGRQRMDDVLLLTMSEFGRTVRENGNRGTDHGHANAMLLVGGNARGGRVYGQWPGLRNDQLFEGRDLALTTDFRDVFGEIAQKHLGNANLPAIFPGYAASPTRFRGLLG